MGVRHAILGLLAERPLHGYDLKLSFEQQLTSDGGLNFGQVYTTLDRLRRDGLVAGDVVPQAERPDKKVYALTDAGRRELEEWLSTPSAIDLDLRNETFLKVMLARRLAWGSPLVVIEVERRAALQRLHEVTRALAAAEREGGPLQTILLLDLATFRLEAFLRWLERCGDRLAQAPAGGMKEVQP